MLNVKWLEVVSPKGEMLMNGYTVAFMALFGVK
jgi:hypothetical protein